jgi:multiple antibiotic resistance protein
MELFLSALVTLVVITDPLGMAVVYGVLTGKMPAPDAKRIARNACLIGGLVMLFFALAGAHFIQLLGISLDAFRISGGLLLFVIAFRMLMGHPEQQDIRKGGDVYAERKDIAVFPLAIPLLSGPGCITAVILLTNQAHTVTDQLYVYAAMLGTVIVAWLCMMGLQSLKKILGEGGIMIMERLFGIVLAALAIQFIADGVKGIIKL